MRKGCTGVQKPTAPGATIGDQQQTGNHSYHSEKCPQWVFGPSLSSGALGNRSKASSSKQCEQNLQAKNHFQEQLPLPT
jgi:hypothetical protein